MSSYAPVQGAMTPQNAARSDAQAGNDGSNPLYKTSVMKEPTVVNANALTATQKTNDPMDDDSLTQAKTNPTYTDDLGMTHAENDPNSTKQGMNTPPQPNAVNPVANETGWIQVHSKRKQADITANAADDTNYQVKQRIHTRGEEAIDATQCLITPVKMEISTRNKKNINLREEFLILLQKMQSVDPQFAIVTDNAVWTEANDIPANEKFMKTFKVNHHKNGNRNQVITMYFSCESKKSLNLIKYHSTVWSYLHDRQIYMFIDNFQTEETACPGYLINIHHKLIWKETLLEQMSEALKQVPVDPSHKVFQRWKQLNPFATTKEIPFFTLKTGTRRMGDTAAMVYNIISAKKDAELLKMLFSKLGEGPNKPRWIFVPTGLHLIASTNLVKSSLCHQNEYLQSITSIAIEGITEENFKNGGENGTSIEESIQRTTPGLESIEKTILMKQRGRWLLVVKKQHQEAIRAYLVNTIIPNIENSGKNLLPGIPVGITGSLISPGTVGNYASTLHKQLTPNAKDLTNAMF